MLDVGGAYFVSLGFDRWVRGWGHGGQGGQGGVCGSRIDSVPLQAVWLRRGGKVGVMGANVITFLSVDLQKEDKI